MISIHSFIFLMELVDDLSTEGEDTPCSFIWKVAVDIG